jgi:FHS family L-fucose permease-like MFS transporter
VPPLTAKAADLHNSTALAMVVPVCFFVAAWSYAVCCNFVPAFRDVMDRVGDSNLGLPSAASVGEVEDVRKTDSLEKV